MKKLKFIQLFIVFISLLLLTTACSSDKTSTVDIPTRLVSYTEDKINREVSSFEADLNDLKASVNAATNEDADTIKKEISQFKINIAAFDKELDDAVENNELSKEIKKSYDSFIENTKTEINKLDKEISSK